MQDQIKEVSQITKVETDFHDLGMYGEYFGIKITFTNGRTWTLRMQEHEFNALNAQENSVFDEGENKMEEDIKNHDLYLSESLHDNGEQKGVDE